jgi:hypothetical protein
MLAIQGWGSPNSVQNDVQKIGENNQKVGNIDQIIS